MTYLQPPEPQWEWLPAESFCCVSDLFSFCSATHFYIMEDSERGSLEWAGEIATNTSRIGERDEIHINETRVMLALEREREVIRRDVTSLVNLSSVLV